MSDGYVKFKLAAGTMNLICLAILVAPAVVYTLFMVIDSGWQGFWNEISSVPSFKTLPILIIIYVTHEALHVLAGLLCGVKFSNFRFGFDKTTLSIECFCNEELSICDYKFFLLLPFLVLTPLLAALAVHTGSQLWWIMLVLSTSGCAFDLTAFLGLTGVPGETRVIPELKGENGYVYIKAAPQ